MENLLKNFLGEKLSIRRINGKGRARIIFTTNYLTSEDIERLNMILSAFKNKKLILLDVGDEFAKMVKAKEQYSHETYYRISESND